MSIGDPSSTLKKTKTRPSQPLTRLVYELNVDKVDKTFGTPDFIDNALRVWNENAEYVYQWTRKN